MIHFAKKVPVLRERWPFAFFVCLPRRSCRQNHLFPLGRKDGFARAAHGDALSFTAWPFFSALFLPSLGWQRFKRSLQVWWAARVAWIMLPLLPPLSRLRNIVPMIITINYPACKRVSIDVVCMCVCLSVSMFASSLVSFGKNWLQKRLLSDILNGPVGRECSSLFFFLRRRSQPIRIVSSRALMRLISLNLNREWCEPLRSLVPFFWVRKVFLKSAVNCASFFALKSTSRITAFYTIFSIKAVDIHDMTGRANES